MTDKMKHILAGFLVALVVGLPAYVESGNLFAGLWPALTGGLMAAGIKEWCDNNTDGNQWDWKDLGWTAAGVAVAVLFIVLLHVGKG